MISPRTPKSLSTLSSAVALASMISALMVVRALVFLLLFLLFLDLVLLDLGRERHAAELVQARLGARARCVPPHRHIAGPPPAQPAGEPPFEAEQAMHDPAERDRGARLGALLAIRRLVRLGGLG